MSNKKQKYQLETIKAFPGFDRVVIYRLATTVSKNWYVRIRLKTGGYFIRSLRTSSKDKAVEKALNHFATIKAKEDSGAPIGSASLFKSLWKKFQAGPYQQMKPARQKRFRLTYKNSLSWFDGYQYSSINENIVGKWVLWRCKNGFSKNGRPIAASTVKGEIDHLKQVLNYAVGEGTMEPFKINSNVNRYLKTKEQQAWVKFDKSRGGAISDKRLKEILDALRENKDRIHTHPQHQWSANLLYYYIMLVNEAGLRPGTEALGLKWGDLKTHKDGNNAFTYWTVRSGKRENADPTRPTRIAVTSIQSYHLIYEWRRLNEEHNSEDDWVFRDYKGNQAKTSSLSRTFKRLVKNNGLDQHNGKTITLYTFRSNRINSLLDDPNLTLSQVSRLSGTSIQTIQQAYFDRQQMLSQGSFYATAAAKGSMVNKK